MNKISSILPASSRTKSVDVSSSQPVRPGAPTFGRQVGRNSLAPVDKVSLSSIATERDEVETPITYNKKTIEASRSKIVDDLANKFFDKKNIDDVVDIDQPLSESVSDEVHEQIKEN